MNVKNRIALILSVLAVIALLVIGMTLVASADDGDILTEYGTIPAAQVSADKPFAIFTKASGATNWTLLGTYADAFADNPLTSYWKVNGEVVILMLDDVDFTNRDPFTNGIRVQPSLTLDMNGHTMTAANKNGLGTFFYQVKTPYNGTGVRNFTIKNGDFILSAKALMMFAENNSADPGVDLLEINVTFDNVKFIRTTYKDQPVVQVGAQNNYAEKVNLTYNDCTFDLTGGANTNNVYLFMVGNSSTTKLEMNIQVNGGEILLNEMNKFKLHFDNAPGQVTFGKGEDGFTSIRVPVGIDASHTVNGGSTKFEKLSTDGTYDYYGVKTGIPTKYGEIPLEYESVATYPFALFKKASGSDSYVFHGAYANPWIDANITSYWNFDGEVVVLLRDNVDFTTVANCSNLFRMRPTMVVDLNNFTFRGSDTGYGTFYIATKVLHNAGTVRNVIFKNGTILTGKSQFILFAESATIEDTAVMNITFDNVIFDRVEGASKDQPFVQVNNCPNYAHTANVTYNNCTFDLRGVGAAKVYLFNAGNNAKTLLKMNVAVNGGKILADSALSAKLQFVLKGAPGSGVTFGKGADGEYITLTLPTVENNFTNQTVNSTIGTALDFIPRKTTEDGTVMKLFPVRLINYVPKTSVTLSSDLIYNIYLPKNRLVSFNLGGVEYTDLSSLKVRQIDGVDYYHVEVMGGVIGAAKDIDLVVTVNCDKENATATRTLGVVQYAKTLLASTTDANEIALAKDMLAYVKAASELAGVNAEEVAAIKAILGDYAPEVSVGTPAQSTVALAGSALLISEHPAFVFYPELDGEGKPVHAVEDYIFHIGERAVKGEVTTDKDGKTCIIVHAFAYEMNSTVHYHVLNEEIYGEYNLAAYHAFAKASGNEALVTVVESLIKYSESALAYKNAKNA